MKLTYPQIEQHLQKNLLPVYIICGDELWLKQDVIQKIRQAAQKKAFCERVRLSPESQFDWNDLYNILYSPSVMAEKRFIEFDFRDALPNKIASKILQEYAVKPNEDNLLLIDTHRADDKILKSSWYHALEKAGAVITIWPISSDQLPKWIKDYAKTQSIILTQDAIALLASYVEGNLSAAASAIEKLTLLDQNKAFDATDIEMMLHDESRFSIFDLVENIISGDTARALRTLSRLREEGEELVLILWGITRELRLLAELCEEKQKGIALDTMFQKYRIFFKRQVAVRHFLTKFNIQDCWQFLSRAADIDLIIKGIKPGDAWRELQLFCLRFK